jgi:putative hydrolase of the HAD superfamily
MADEPRAVLFDFGGVLLKQDWAAYSAFDRKHGLPERTMITALYRTAEWKAFETGKASRDAWVAAFRREIAVLAAERAEAIAAEWFARPVEYHDPNITLAKALAGVGVRVGLLSNAGPDLEERLLAERVDIPFHDIVVSGVVGLAKPDHAIYHLAATNIGVSVERCFFIDDLETNVAAAREVGMSAHHFRGDYAGLEQALREAGYRW